MIELSVYDRCHDCPDFDPIKIEHVLYGDGIPVIRETKVVCKHVEFCDHLLKYLHEGLKSGEK